MNNLRKNILLFLSLAIILSFSVAVLAGCGQRQGQNSGQSAADPQAALSEPEASVPPPPEPIDGTPPREDITPYLPAEDLPPYALVPITQTEYQGEFFNIEFVELPKTDAETLVCNEYYSWAVECGPASAAQWLPGCGAPVPLSNEATSSFDFYEFVKVNSVRELTAEEAIALDDGYLNGKTLFDPWVNRGFGGGLTNDEYMTAIIEDGCALVLADIETRYTDEKRALGPQLDDGQRTELWLLVPDEDGNLKLFSNTRFFGQFTPPYFDEFVPPVMDRSNV